MHNNTPLRKHTSTHLQGFVAKTALGSTAASSEVK
jgi:hypothetical protein